MKKNKIILLCCGLLFTLVITAQSNSRFPLQPSSTWRVDSVGMWEIVENVRYFFNGDTTINNRRFFKLYKSGVLLFDTPYYYKDAYVGALRDNENKIYFIKKNKNIETLLFDFNLKIGDTIQSYIGKGKPIISIDTLQDGRRAFYYAKDHFNLGYYIEGIGSNGGLFSAGSAFVFIHSGEMTNYLICYSENGKLVYQAETNLQSNCDIVNIDHKFSIDITAIWRYDKEASTDTFPNYERYQYYFSHDTIIGQIKYLKLYKEGFYLDCRKDGKFASTYENKYSGALRDKDNKYYFISNGSYKEELLYDFNLNVGDIIESEVFKGETVFHIDTAFDNRKRFYLSTDRYSKIVIEGIGSVNDFIEGKLENTYLHCFSINKVPVYHHAADLECRLDIENTTFPVCNSVHILPELTSSSDFAKFQIITCYQIPANSSDVPHLSNYTIQKNDFNFSLNLFYINNNINDPGKVQLSYTVFDTISLGQLMAGQYRVDCTVNTIHNESYTDTVFNDKSYWRSFMVQSSSIAIPSVKEGSSKIRVYPVPAKDKIIVEVAGTPVINSIEMYNVVGIKVFSLNPKTLSKTSNGYELNISNLRKGVYFLWVREIDTFSTYKVIIE
jgi:hypothetical protein